MIVVETPVRTIERELEALQDCATGSATRMYVLGARQALLWIKDGAMPASNLFEVISNPAVRH